MKLKWTKDKCQEEALKYNTKTEYQKLSHSSYNSALKNKWIDAICSHMKLVQNPNGFWTKEKCQNIALKYKTRIDFFNNDSGVYSKCVKEKWLNDICKHMNPKKLRYYWNEENCIKESLKYDTKIEFAKNSPRAYQLCLTNDWLKDCDHLISYGDLTNRCIYAYEFQDNSVYVGLTFNLKKRHDFHLNSGAVYKYIQKSNLIPNLIQLTDYINVEEAKNKEGEYVEKYRINGWNILNKNKTGVIGCNKQALNYLKTLSKQN